MKNNFKHILSNGYVIHSNVDIGETYITKDDHYICEVENEQQAYILIDALIDEETYGE